MNLSFRAGRASLTLLSAVLLGWIQFVDGLPATAADIAVIKGNRANLRSSPSLDGEVVGTVFKGDRLLVLENTPTKNPQPDDPISWAKVMLPSSVKVWVFAQFVDPKTSTVTSHELKIRTGPGKNYSAIGELKKGDDVEAIRTVDGWTQIEPPEDAVAYIAGNLIEISGPAPTARSVAALASTKPSSPPAASPQPTASTPLPATGRTGPGPGPGKAIPTREVPQAQPLNTPPPVVASEPPRAPVRRQNPLPAEAETSPVASTPPPAPAPTPASVPAASVPVPAPAVTAPSTPPPVEISSSVQYRQPELVYHDDQPRRVLREGIVSMSMSPDAPTLFQLDSFRRREGAFDYLLVENPKELQLSHWRGKRVFIEGDEYRDRRWHTPVLKVRTIRAAN